MGPAYALTHIYPASYVSTVMSTLEVVAEPSRRFILDLLVRREMTVNELVDQLSLSQPAVSKHLRVLRDGGLVSVRRDGQRRVYRLTPEPLVEIDNWLAPFREAWSRRLDALETHLDSMED